MSGQGYFGGETRESEMIEPGAGGRSCPDAIPLFPYEVDDLFAALIDDRVSSDKKILQ